MGVKAALLLALSFSLQFGARDLPRRGLQFSGVCETPGESYKSQTVLTYGQGREGGREGQRPWGTLAREVAILKALLLSSPRAPLGAHSYPVSLPPPSPDMISLLLNPGGPRKEIFSSHTREL